MSKVFIEEDSLTAIGNAIRSKTGDTAPLSVPTGMVEAIAGITGGGGEPLDFSKLKSHRMEAQIGSSSGAQVARINLTIPQDTVFGIMTFNGRLMSTPSSSLFSTLYQGSAILIKDDSGTITLVNNKTDNIRVPDDTPTYFSFISGLADEISQISNYSLSDGQIVLPINIYGLGGSSYYYTVRYNAADVDFIFTYYTKS